MTVAADESPLVPPERVTAKTAVQRLTGALIAPLETFADVARRPNLLAPVVLLIVVTALSAFVQASRLDYASAFREQFRERFHDQKMPPEQLERMVRFSSGLAKATTYFAPLLAPLMLALIAGVLLIVFRLLGGEGGFKQAFSVVLHAWLPYLILSVVMAVVLLVRRHVSLLELPTLVRSNPGFLVSMKRQPVAFALLSSLDVFTIWVVALLSLGFAEVAQVTRRRAAVTVVVLWMILLLVKVGLAGLQAAAGT